MPRVVPEAGLADFAFVRGIGAEAGELAVGEGFAKEAGGPKGDTDEATETESHAGGEGHAVQDDKHYGNR